MPDRAHSFRQHFRHSRAENCTPKQPLDPAQAGGGDGAVCSLSAFGRQATDAAIHSTRRGIQ